MKTLYVLLLYGVLHGSLVIAEATGEIWTSLGEVFGSHHNVLTTQVGDSKLVVVGSVTEKRFVWDAFGREPATEITVTADTVIKGIPNAGEDTVKFMVSGGEAVDPRSGALIETETRPWHEFQIGEQTLFFFNQKYKHTAAYKAHPYDGIYLDSHYPVSSENGTVTLALIGEHHPKAELHVNLVVALGKATVVDRETAMMIEAAILEVMMMAPRPDTGPIVFAMKFTRRLIFTCENLLEGYEAGVNAAMEQMHQGEHDSVVTVTSQTFAEEKGYCRGFVDTMKHHFDVDYYCICDRHWSYQIKRPEK